MLSNFEVSSITDLGEDWLFTQSAIINQLINDFTPKQLEILMLAFEKGYCNIPRSTRTLDIANELGKTRYGVDKGLRSAENKIIEFIMPFVYLHSSNINIKSVL